MKNTYNHISTTINEDMSIEQTFEKEVQHPLPLDTLLTMDYKDMTEEEIEMVVEWKAQVKANEAAYQEQMEMQQQALETIIAKYKESAEIAAGNLSEIEEQAMKRLDDACKITVETPIDR